MPRNKSDFLRPLPHFSFRYCYWLLFLAAVGCTSYGEIKNTEIENIESKRGYSLREWRQNHDRGEITLILTFSGGGTRAAAMAYGVLEELRDTNYLSNGVSKRLLDEVDDISSVSGGSFTAAFYGLHGEEIFDTFENEFLRLDMDKPLTESLVDPLHWFTHKGRTERTIEYYEKALFHGATYADMMKPGRPMIIINTSDLAYGVRFSFIQEYFNFLCSDLTDFKVARAVTASSAVPILFNPVVIKNYASCGDYDSIWPEDAAEYAPQDAEFRMLYEGLKSYADKSHRKYIHFVDGGITDNMGLRAAYDMILLSGGPNSYFKNMRAESPSHVVVISVNASTHPMTEMDESNKEPSIIGAVNAMSGVQLHRYNTDTIEVMQSKLSGWAKLLSTPGHEVHAHFIQVTFQDVNEPQLKLSLNKIPTSFHLTNEQVDSLIETSRSLLRESAGFKALLNELNEQ